MAGPSCAETVLRGAGAGEVVTVTGNRLDVNAVAAIGVTTVPAGDPSIIESTVGIPTAASTIVAAANAVRRFIQINWNAATAGTVAWLGLTAGVGVLTSYFQELADGGVFWLDNNVIIGETFFIYTSDPAGGTAGVLEY